MGLYERLKDAASVLREASKIEQYGQILEMQKKINELEINNKELREQLEMKEKLVCEGNAYWLKDKDGQNDGPFCTCCWDSERKSIRLHINQDFNSAECPKCKTRARPGKAIIIRPIDHDRNSAR